tara:strand:+ start:6348 stop:7418 length:1071 start_codon:yes stop_codon:yes gene_type:complete
MKVGRDHVDFIAEVKRQAATKKDFVVPQNAMRYSLLNGGSVTLEPESVNPQWYKITDQASKQLATKLKIPTKYFMRMQELEPELLSNNVNTWLESDQRGTMVRTLDGRIRAFLSDRYNRIDNYDVLNQVEPILTAQRNMGNLTIQSCEISNRRMYLKATFPKLSREVSKSEVGDIVEAGVSIANSETGHGSFEIAPLIFRTLCKNGMVSTDKLTRRHLGAHVSSDDDGIIYRNETIQADDKALLMKIEDTLRSILDSDTFDRAVDRFSETKEIRFTGSPNKIIKELSNNYDLNDLESEGILTALFEAKDDNSAFGIINAVTRFSQDVEDYDRASELESLGGKLLNLSNKEWMRMAA